MKKLTLLLALLLVSVVIKAQNKYCTDITKNSINATVIYTSPTPPFVTGKMRLSLNKTIYAAGSTMDLQIGPETANDTNTTSISIIFADKDRLQFSNVHYKKDYSNAVYSLKNNYIPTVTLSQDDMAKLKTKKINYFTVNNDGHLYDTGGARNQIMGYVACLENQTALANEIDPNSLISKKFDDMKNLTTYSTSYNSNIQLYKTISVKDTVTQLIFSIYKNTADNAQQTVYVKFNDGTVLNYPSITICAKMEHVAGYLYQCIVILNNNNIKDFKDKKIVKFQMADTNIIVDAPLGSSVNTWVNIAENLR